MLQHSATGCNTVQNVATHYDRLHGRDARAWSRRAKVALRALDPPITARMSLLALEGTRAEQSTCAATAATAAAAFRSARADVSAETAAGAIVHDASYWTARALAALRGGLREARQRLGEEQQAQLRISATLRSRVTIRQAGAELKVCDHPSRRVGPSRPPRLQRLYAACRVLHGAWCMFHRCAVPSVVSARVALPSGCVHGRMTGFAAHSDCDASVLFGGRR
jgi:hypothetical protein